MLEDPYFCPSRDDSGDDDLSVLPRDTKVIVTGNNRTKSVLVGLQGVVKKAVGLGGWHWLVLKNGIEVKLQRNALSVLEHPTGNEDDTECYFESSSSSDVAAAKEHLHAGRIEFRKPRKPKVRHARSWGPPPPGSGNLVSKESNREVESLEENPQQRVNFAKLRTDALSRYCKHYKLTSSNDAVSREQMINSVCHHFASQRVNENKVIKEFIRAAKKIKKGPKIVDIV